MGRKRLKEQKKERAKIEGGKKRGKRLKVEKN